MEKIFIQATFETWTLFLKTLHKAEELQKITAKGRCVFPEKVKS